MIYKPSSFNYSLVDGNELLIINFKKGVSSFHTVSQEDTKAVKQYLSENLIEINIPTASEQTLIDNGFLVPADLDEDLELELIQSDYINNNILQLVIHVTKDCNFRCKYCFLDFEHEKMHLMVQDKVVDYIRKNISKYSGVYISWFGGEPLMGMDVITYMSEKIIDICKKAKKPYLAGMTTNGYLLTPETIEKLISLKVYSYCITLDGLKNSHDTQRVLINGNPTYQMIINNLRYIRDHVKFRYLNICIRTNFTKTTLDSIDDYLSFLNLEFGDDSRFAPYFKLAYDWGGDRIDEVRQTLLEPHDIKTIYCKFLDQKSPMYIHNVSALYLGGMTCDSIRRHKYTISTEGKIAKCDTVCEETIVGYIDSTGWHLDKTKEAQWLFSYRIKSQECSSCPFRCICFQGSCPKKKILGFNSSSCPRPVFMDQLMLMYKKVISEGKENLL